MPALSAYTRAHTLAHAIANPAGSPKSLSCWQGTESLSTSRLERVLPPLWAAAAKCPAHVLFYESLASMRLFYYYYLS